MTRRWNYEKRKNTRRAPKRRLTRAERVAGSILVAEAQIRESRRRLWRLGQEIVDARAHLARLREIEARLHGKSEGEAA